MASNSSGTSWPDPRYAILGKAGEALRQSLGSLPERNCFAVHRSVTALCRLRQPFLLRGVAAMPPTLRTLHPAEKIYMQRFHRSSRFFSYLFFGSR